MSTAEILAELTKRGIRLEACGDRLRFWPLSAGTPELMDRLKASKGQLLAILKCLPGCVAPSVELAVDSVNAIQSGDSEPVDGGLPEWLGNSSEWGPDGWPVDTVPPTPTCARCGSCDAWQTLAGTWRCLSCDPPTKAKQVRERAARLRERYATTPANQHGRPGLAAS